VFRRHDVSGVGKAAWLVFIIILPFIGVLSYLIINSPGMAERNMRDVQQAQAATEDYIRSVAGGAAADIESESASRRRRHHAGGVRSAQGEGAGLLREAGRPATACRPAALGSGR
jgi:hypothetical protein